jgi:hypothetical protein
MQFWLMLRLVLISIIWMYCVCHVSRDEKALVDGPIKVLFREIWLQTLEYTLSGLHYHIAISSLSRG